MHLCRPRGGRGRCRAGSVFKDRVEKRFDEFFAERSKYEYDLVPLPQALEGSMTWGYYQGPSANDRRGLYNYNGSKLDSQAVIGAASLVFHELVPGHHLHMTLQRENKNLPPIRKNGFVNAFNEGWTEYAATLTGEMGLYDDPYDRYGRHVFDAFLTSRLVVDTGMNALGWSWEQAKAYMRAHAMRRGRDRVGYPALLLWHPCAGSGLQARRRGNPAHARQNS
jgi:uncharacterized protein (DUF885 family)